MLVGEGESSKIAYNSLSKDFNIKMVIEDTSISKKTFLKRRVKKIGYLKVFGQILFMLYIKFMFKSSKNRINSIKKEHGLISDFYPKELFKKVASINNEKTIEILLKSKPDIIIVNGTRIISQKILNTINTAFVNIHAGITPAYRGVHGGYWAIANNDANNFGVTLHYIDKGIDTGSIIAQDIIKINDNDNFVTYPLIQLSHGLILLKKFLSNFSRDNVTKRNKYKTPSHQYYHPTLWFYLYKFFTKNIK